MKWMGSQSSLRNRRERRIREGERERENERNRIVDRLIRRETGKGGKVRHKEAG